MNLNKQDTCPPVDSITETPSIPAGYCQCGCGRLTNLASCSNPKWGWIKNEPVRFISGHHRAVVRAPSRIVIINGIERRTVPLTQGYEAIVDIDSYEKFAHLRCTANINKRKDGSIRNVYASCKVWTPEGWKSVGLHRLILGITDSKIYVDHADCDGLDNLTTSLRPADPSQNMGNSRKRWGLTSSRFKGTSYCANYEKWHAQIRIHGEGIDLGFFDLEEDAACAYDAACVLFGVFSRSNVKLGLLPPLTPEDELRVAPITRKKPGNRRMSSNNTSGYKGVSPKGKRWLAQMGIDGKPKCLGVFDTAIEAARRYDVEALLVWGPDALTNVKLGLLPPLD